MRGPATVSPFQAILAAKAADPYRKQRGTIPRDMPAPKGTGSFARFVHEVGYVIDLFLDPCQIDPWMLVTTGAAAVLRAFYSIISPDPKELFHILSGKSVVCTLKEQISEQGTFERIGWDGAKQTLFRIGEIADLAFWRLFLGSVFADGLVDWQTNAQILSGCSKSKSLYSSVNAQGAIPAANGTFMPIGLEWLTTGFPPAFVPGIVLLPGDTGYIIWHADVGVPPETTPYPVAAWIEDYETGATVHGPIYSNKMPDGTFRSPILFYRPQVLAHRQQHYVLRAKGLLDAPHGELFFIKGYCAAKGTFVD